jgi:hypothetical protein
VSGDGYADTSWDTGVIRHRVCRSWLRLGMRGCSCGRRAGHQNLVPPPVDSRIPDGDVVPLTGYARYVDLLALPRESGLAS